MLNSKGNAARLNLLAALSLLIPASAHAQSANASTRSPRSPELLKTYSYQEGQAGAGSPTPVAELIEEAERNNPQILAARHGWKAATAVPSQVSTPPDPEFMVQQFAVGSPRPFAGYTNSDFAYIGFGVSQDLPYPGKLHLRGELAEREAAVAREHFEAVRRSVIEQVKGTYFMLAYERQELEILARDGKLLDQVAKIAEARYRVGQGNQQDVLKAQLEQTKILRDTATHQQRYGILQAQMKQLLNRPANQPDIVPEPLADTLLAYTLDELLDRVRAENPEVLGQSEMVRRDSLAVELARKDFYPDFNAQYMWQHTASQFRDYYMLTFGVRIPIYRSRRQQPELTQNVEGLNRSRREYEAQVQQTFFDVRDDFLEAETAERVLTMYREGLIPQAAGVFNAGLAAYESNREDFETLVTSFVDVLRLDEEYWRTLLDHETALARLEQLTGIDLQAGKEGTK
jgi:outer membrane protein, heavy metal efflux system